MIATQTRYELDDIAARLRPHETVFRKFRAIEMSLFVPPSGTEARAKGLLGVMVAYDPDVGMSLFDFGRIDEAIKQIIGLDSDVVTRKGLFPEVVDEIERSEVKVF